MSAIVTSQYLRARQTAEPIAAALKIDPEVITKDDARELRKALKRRVRATVLVIGHSDTIPIMLKGLGHREDMDFPKAEFNNAWLVVPRTDAPPIVTRVRF